MKRAPLIILLLTTSLALASLAVAARPEGTMTFAVSMKQPTTHYYHVVFRCEGLKGETQDFKMPSWTPGYYWILNSARNVLNFRAEDGAGNAMAWEKISKNTWRIKSGKAAAITVSYDAYAFERSIAESFLDDSRGFISPTGIFMHVAGCLGHPVTVSFEPYKEWSKISTGLDPVAGQPHTFFAPNFDVLYDCPVLMGNQEILTFEIKGIPHVIAAENLGTVDRARFKSDLAKIVEAAARLIGEIPYKHYTFIFMDGGGGGIEHLNSVSAFFNGSGLNSRSGYLGGLSFIAHEFFHLYNVKRIRPIALGPFDYDRENYTSMLWVSEGINVYYEDIILRRAGLMTRDEFLERARSYIMRYENVPGHLFQSAAASSFDTWINFFVRGENSANTTISYYDKGAALGLLLDLKIRSESKNKRSLDDVMRTLYWKYHKGMKRGFKDEEFRRECENAAGCPLPEIFDVYASTTGDVDYPKYFSLAGLEIDLTPKELPGAFLGAAIQIQDGNPVISSVEWDSPAQRGGLSARDEVLALDGIRVHAPSIGQVLESKKPGDKVRVLLARRGMIREVEVTLGTKTERSFQIRPIADPTPLQSAVLEDWLREEGDHA